MKPNVHRRVFFEATVRMAALVLGDKLMQVYEAVKNFLGSMGPA